MCLTGDDELGEDASKKHSFFTTETTDRLLSRAAAMYPGWQQQLIKQPLHKATEFALKLLVQL